MLLIKYLWKAIAWRFLVLSTGRLKNRAVFWHLHLKQVKFSENFTVKTRESYVPRC